MEADMADIVIGVMTNLSGDVRHEMEKVRSFGLSSTQTECWDDSQYTIENIGLIKNALIDFDVEISSLWTGYPGHAAWNFIDGPATIGLVPPETRDIRVKALIKGAEFAAELGLPSITTHAGFIPENPGDPLYAGTVEALAKVAGRCFELGLEMCFETGQETPITLLRVMRDIGTPNLGINLDPANLLMYGKANPIDAIDIFGSRIKGVHAKDGEYPVEPDELGAEKPLGEGRVNFEMLLAKLLKMGYGSPITIEREISGERQIEDIKRAVKMLRETASKL